MKKSLLLSLMMLFVTMLLVTATFVYLSQASTSEEALRSDKHLITLNGPWKFITGDSLHYADPGYDDSKWESLDLTAPVGVHDDDVGLSGFIPGWTSNGHASYSGYAWYRLKISLDSLQESGLALTGPPAVDDAYQLFINGIAAGDSGDFSGAVPTVYSIRPRMFLLPENVKKEKELTLAFRVWMSPASLSAGAGGIHIAPTLGEKTHLRKKYRFQWEQTIKGYIIEVVWPLLFVLLAITLFVYHKWRMPSQSCKWMITALILLGLMRLNQAVYFWFRIENNFQAVIIGSVILRPLVLGSWLMAWKEWFKLDRPKWLPKIIAILSLLFMAAQLFSISRISHAAHNYFSTIGNYTRLLLLLLHLFILFLGIRKQGRKDVLVFLAAVLMLIALFPQEISALQIIPGIWFPYGVGVSRGQYFYMAFVFVMYAVLIQKSRTVQTTDPK